MDNEYRPRYLVMVTAGNNNKYYRQIPNGDGTWGIIVKFQMAMVLGLLNTAELALHRKGALTQ